VPVLQHIWQHPPMTGRVRTRPTPASCARSRAVTRRRVHPGAHRRRRRLGGIRMPRRRRTCPTSTSTCRGVAWTAAMLRRASKAWGESPAWADRHHHGTGWASSLFETFLSTRRFGVGALEKLPRASPPPAGPFRRLMRIDCNACSRRRYPWRKVPARRRTGWCKHSSGTRSDVHVGHAISPVCSGASHEGNPGCTRPPARKNVLKPVPTVHPG